MRMFVLCLVACSSPPSPAAEHPTPPPPPVAAVDAAPPADAGVPEEVTAAPAWIFRFNTPGRVETWTLRFANEHALLVVEAATGTTRYQGSMSDALALRVKAGSALMSLDCKREKQAIGTKCNDTKAKKIDVLACYHPDFKSPMTFGAEPGIEYVANDSCTGYRLIGP
jgi:hypothetical protein